MRFLLCCCFTLPFLADWGFVVNGEMVIGLTTNRSADNIYMRVPATRVTKEDRLIQTGAEKSSQTGVKQTIRTPMPSLALPSLYSQSYVGGRTADAKATDVSNHLAAGERMPVITNQAAIGLEIDRKINEWIVSNLASVVMCEVSDPLADKLNYNTDSSLSARGESYYECFKVFFEKSFAYPMTSDKEDIFYLLLYGEPAAPVLAEKHIVKIKGLTKEYLDPEKKPPEFLEGKDDFDTMMFRLITLELFPTIHLQEGFHSRRGSRVLHLSFSILISKSCTRRQRTSG